MNVSGHLLGKKAEPEQQTRWCKCRITRGTKFAPRVIINAAKCRASQVSYADPQMKLGHTAAAQPKAETIGHYSLVGRTVLYNITIVLLWLVCGFDSRYEAGKDRPRKLVVLIAVRGRPGLRSFYLWQQMRGSPPEQPVKWYTTPDSSACVDAQRRSFVSSIKKHIT